MEGVDFSDDSQDDSCVQFHPLMGMFVLDSIGVPGVEDDVAAVAEVKGDVVAEAGVGDDVSVGAVAVDAICEMDVIVADTYESEDDVVFEEMVAVSEEEMAARVTVLEAEEVSCSLASEEDGHLGFNHGCPKKYKIPDLNLPSTEDLMYTSEVKVDMDFDLNKLPIRGMFRPKDDPLYEESFIQMLRILLPDYY